MKIIVISVTPYKESDAIVNAISEDGAIAFLARGILKPQSKNAGLNTNLVIADIELSESNNKYPILKSSLILSSPIQLNSDLSYLGVLMVINEATKIMLQDEEKKLIYSSLIEAINALKEGLDPWMIMLIYIGRIFKYSGYEFEVNKCVFCGSKKDIKTFSFSDGGFVCSHCLRQDTKRDLSNEQMLLLRSVISADSFAVSSPYASSENKKIIFRKFLEFIVDSYGIHLKSASLLD
ncbi:MAG: DNA repair protein RecO [Bacilli bacterium]